MLQGLRAAQRLPGIEMSIVDQKVSATQESPGRQPTTKAEDSGRQNSGFVAETTETAQQQQGDTDGAKRVQGSMDFLTLNDTASSEQMRRQSSVSQFSHFSGADFSASQQPDADQPQRPRRRFRSSDNYIQDQVPVLPVPAAACVLACNIVLPGLGTVLSGLLFLCFSRPEQRKMLGWFEPVCVNCWVGVSQLLTVTFLLVGWGWSIAWGVYALQKALDNRDEQRQKRKQEIAERALHALMNGQEFERSAGGGGLINLFRRGK